MYFAGKLVYLIVRTSNQLAVSICKVFEYSVFSDKRDLDKSIKKSLNMLAISPSLLCCARVSSFRCLSFCDKSPARA